MAAFLREHKVGINYVHPYITEQIAVPGSSVPRTVLRRVTHDFKAGRIVVAKEDIFSAIDEWHCQNGHMGQERTHVYCSKKYYNITQEHVKIYVRRASLARRRILSPGLKGVPQTYLF